MLSACDEGAWMFLSLDVADDDVKIQRASEKNTEYNKVGPSRDAKVVYNFYSR